ncbi:MAG: hypothetical protein ACKODS_08040, partial [Methylophilaceae bacterium]
ITISRDPLIDGRCFAGLAMTRKNPTLIAMNIVMRYLGKDATARMALSGIGPVHIDDPSLSPEVKLLCTTMPMRSSNHIEIIGVDDIVRELGSKNFIMSSGLRKAS